MAGGEAHGQAGEAADGNDAESLGVALNFKWRCLSELFGVVFQDYLA